MPAWSRITLHFLGGWFQWINCLIILNLLDMCALYPWQNGMKMPRSIYIVCIFGARKKWEQTEYWCVILIKYAIEWDMVLGWNLPLLLFCSWTTRLFITFAMIFVVNIIIGSFDRYTMNIGWFCSLCWVVHGTFHYPISTAKPPRHFQNGYRSAHAKKTLHPKQRGE